MVFNPYIEKINEFPELIFDFNKAHPFRGKWLSFIKAEKSLQAKKIILEIGCSNAHFLADLAEKNPDYFFIGMDWKYKILYKGAHCINKKKLKNILLVRMHAQDAPALFEKELDEAWMFFPDPWPKKAQLKHRLFQEKFLLDLHHCFRREGVFHFKTDHPGYYEWCLSLFGKKPRQNTFNYQKVHNEALEFNRVKRQVEGRRRDLSEFLPPASEALTKLYQVEKESQDFELEKGLLYNAANKTPIFLHHHTLFEKKFIHQGLPIYYLDLLVLTQT